MRILLPAVWRLGVDGVVLWLVGGAPALTRPIALTFLAIEGVWSLVEGGLAAAELSGTRADRMRAATAPLDDATRAFVFAGKRWAFVSLAY